MNVFVFKQQLTKEDRQVLRFLHIDRKIKNERHFRVVVIEREELDVEVSNIEGDAEVLLD